MHSAKTNRTARGHRQISVILRDGITPLLITDRTKGVEIQQGYSSREQHYQTLYLSDIYCTLNPARAEHIASMSWLL